MSDLSRHLPLSNRERSDEADVTGDWRGEIADIVLRAAELAPNDAARAGFLSDAGLPPAPVTDLVTVAAGIRDGGRRRIRSLVDATRALLVLAGGEPVALPARTSGAVALYAATRMSFDRRAAVAGSTLVATDAGWSFGRGPARPAPALDILRFVLALEDRLPPVAPPTDRHKL